MVFDHIVKVGRTFYEAGVDVPIEDEKPVEIEDEKPVEKEQVIEKEETEAPVRRRGRRPKEV